MSRKSKEKIAAQKEADRQKLLAERRDKALQDYKGGGSGFCFGASWR